MTFQIYMDSWSNSLDASIFSRTFIFGFFIRERGVARWDPFLSILRMKLCMHTKFRSVAPRFCLTEVPFLSFFHHQGNHFPELLAHFLS